MKTTHLLLLAGTCCFVWAQTNVLAQEPLEQEVGIHSTHWYFDGKTLQWVYYDNVVVTNRDGKMTCERLTTTLPPERSAANHPMDIVAETNVVIDFIKDGDTNHITADKAVWAYSVVNGVTNESITLTGHARGENSKTWMTGEPLVWDMTNNRYYGTDFKSVFKTTSGSGVNPFDSKPIPHTPPATHLPGSDTNYPPGKLDLIPPGHPGNSAPQPGRPPPLQR
jgi:lipopolysaccharide export system protein LptA